MPIEAVISSLPANGGSAITALQYQVNGGSAVAFSAATTGTYSTTAVPGDEVRVRAVNAVGEGPWSDIKTIAVGASEILLNPTFANTSVWTGTDLVTPTAFSIAGGNLTITNRGATFDDGVFQDVALLSGRSYDISVTVVSATGGGVRIKMGVQDIEGLTPLTTPGTYTAIFTNSTSTSRPFIISTSQSAASVVVSSVSLTLRP